MLRDNDHSFRVRIGRLPARDRQPIQPLLPFARQVMRSAAKQAGGLQRLRGGATQGRRKLDARHGQAEASTRRASGRFNARGRGRKAAAILPRTNAWSAAENGMRFRARRVIVKARVVPMRGLASRAGEAHMRYLERDGVNDLHRGSIVEVGPAPIGGQAADRTIAAIAREDGGVYRPSRHRAQAIEMVRVPHDDHAGHVEAHVRRLEALRRASIVERLDPDRWHVPDDFEQRAASYDAKRNPQTAVRLLSAFDLERQVTSDGATWLDRQLLGGDRIDTAQTGFGRELSEALARRQQALVEQGHATHGDDGRMRYRPNLLATLERQERLRVGEQLARNRDVPFRATEDGERVRGTFKQTVQLASGKYALIENALEFTLLPWRPIIERRRGQDISGLMHGTSVSWDLGRNRGLGR